MVLFPIVTSRHFLLNKAKIIEKNNKLLDFSLPFSRRDAFFQSVIGFNSSSHIRGLACSCDCNAVESSST